MKKIKKQFCLCHVLDVASRKHFSMIFHCWKQNIVQFGNSLIKNV